MQYEILHQQLMDLEEKGLVFLQWKNQKRGNILEKVTFVPEQAKAAYEMLHRKERYEKEEKLLEICGKMHEKSHSLDRFVVWIEENLSKGESVKKYCDSDDRKGLQDHVTL